MQQQVYKFVLQGAIVPKARPRVTRNGTFLPIAYSQWKSAAIVQLQRQAGDRALLLTEAEIGVSLSGKHSRRGDLDNTIGAILDALVQAKILKDDSMMHLTGASIRLFWNKNQAPKAEILITCSQVNADFCYSALSPREKPVSIRGVAIE